VSVMSIIPVISLNLSATLDIFRTYSRGHYREPFYPQLQDTNGESIVSQTLLVMGATLSPCLSELLPPPHQMNAIISDVVREIGRYAHLAPSLSLSADIIREADNRRRHSMPASVQSPRPG
jgi:hypothetical protein